MNSIKKLKLDNLKVESFVTNLKPNDLQTIEGGGITWVLKASGGAFVWCVLALIANDIVNPDDAGSHSHDDICESGNVCNGQLVR